MGGLVTRPFFRFAAAGLAVGLAAIAALWALRTHRPLSVQFEGSGMGTRYRVVCCGDLPDAKTLKAVATRVQKEMDELTGLFSLFDSGSAVCRFNRSEQGLDAADPRLFEILVDAETFSRQSGGTFDVTVAPLVRLWGFGPEKKPAHRPSPEQIRAALARTGHELLQFDPVTRSIRKALAGVEIDLGGIAQGYGADRVAAILDSAGITRYLVDVGGEMTARGASPRGQPWRIGIRTPEAGGEASSFRYRVELNGRALGTSGDYLNYYEMDGARYSHVIDPHTGLPVPQRQASCTVLAPTATQADALAKIVLILGPEEGFARLRALPGVDAVYLCQKDGRVSAQTTSGARLFEEPRD